MLFAALLRCTSYNGNAIFSGNQSISFAQDSTVRAEYLVRAGLDGSRRTRRFAQVSTVRAGLDGSRRTRRFSQTELDSSRRTRRFAQDSTVRAGLDGSRRTRRFAQDSTVLADRTRRFAQDSTVRAGLDPFGRYGACFGRTARTTLQKYSTFPSNNVFRGCELERQVHDHLLRCTIPNVKCHPL